jgi:hypothetical protein
MLFDQLGILTKRRFQMPSEVTARQSRKSARLQPSEELRRPDEHGQLPHIILTTYPDRPINELQADDILEINWTGVQTAIRDAVIRVKHEGDLSSSTMRETIQLIALALKKLEMEDAVFQRRLTNLPGIGFVGWLIALTPTAIGKRAREVIKTRRESLRKSQALGETRDTLFRLRVELAKAVDAKVDALLLLENQEYRKLQQHLASLQVICNTAKNILQDLCDLEEIEKKLARNNDAYHVSVRTNRMRKKQLESKLPAFIEFCEQHTGQEVTVNTDTVGVCLWQVLAELDAKASPYERQMEALRDARKQELYGSANASIDTDDQPNGEAVSLKSP